MGSSAGIFSCKGFAAPVSGTELLEMTWLLRLSMFEEDEWCSLVWPWLSAASSGCILEPAEQRFKLPAKFENMHKYSLLASLSVMILETGKQIVIHDLGTSNQTDHSARVGMTCIWATEVTPALGGLISLGKHSLDI